MKTNTQINETSLKTVAVGYCNQLRHMDGMTSRAEIMRQINFVSTQYGARKEIGSELLKEVVRLILQKFSFLSGPEITEAYRDWASGNLDVKGADMYGGEFNAAQVGKILSAYSENRKQILSAYLKAKAEIEKENIQEEKKRLAKEKFDQEFPLMIKKAREEITDWREVKEFWYQCLLNRGWIDFTREEALKIFEDAQELAAIEQANREEENRGKLISYLGTTDDLAKVIARKLTVFRFVIQAPEWEPALKID